MDFDFQADRFSSSKRSERREAHSIQAMQPHRLCDGVLVSLAQQVGSKGFLKRTAPTSPESLAPKSVRDHFGLSGNQWVFGDCGAFTYVGEPEPTITVEQAVAYYDLYDFDMGASVDHIPLPAVPGPDGMRELSDDERKERLKITRNNAERFPTDP